jgi:UDP-glucose 4-epimerase
VLVTGGAGYIGSHAAQALREAGYRVTVYDNLSAGHRWAALGAPLIEGDIADVEAVRRALRDTGASAVMHFAAWLNVSDSVADPAGYYRNNVMGTLATLEAMAAESCRRFVFSSTCAVYGEPVETPISETHPTAPIHERVGDREQGGVLGRGVDGGELPSGALGGEADVRDGLGRDGHPDRLPAPRDLARPGFSL